MSVYNCNTFGVRENNARMGWTDQIVVILDGDENLKTLIEESKTY